MEDFETANKDVEYTEEEKKNLYAELASAAESSWDFSSRWSKQPMADDKADGQSTLLRQSNIRALVPVDLNSILHRVHKRISWLYNLTDNKTAINTHEKRANELREAVLDLNWDGSSDRLSL